MIQQKREDVSPEIWYFFMTTASDHNTVSESDVRKEFAKNIPLHIYNL